MGEAPSWAPEGTRVWVRPEVVELGNGLTPAGMSWLRVWVVADVLRTEDGLRDQQPQLTDCRWGCV